MQQCDSRGDRELNLSGFQVEKFILKAGAKHWRRNWTQGSTQPTTHRARALSPRQRKPRAVVQHHHLGIYETAKQHLLLKIKIFQAFQQLCSMSPLVPRLCRHRGCLSPRCQGAILHSSHSGHRDSKCLQTLRLTPRGCFLGCTFPGCFWVTCFRMRHYLDSCELCHPSSVSHRGNK